MNNEIINISGVECYEENGTAYLKLDTVARGLGFTRIAESGNEVVRWDRVEGYLTSLGVPTCGHDAFIPENIFYRLAMKAKNEVAEAFQAKIADEVIPSIRKHGMYATDNLLERTLEDPDFMIDLLQQLKAERKARKQQQALIEEYKPKVDYYEKILSSKDTMNISQIAADYGLSAKKLNKLLKQADVQYKNNGQWILKKKYQDQGYTESITYHYEHSDGSPGSKPHTRWTQKGRLLIHEVLTEQFGILALMDR